MPFVPLIAATSLGDQIERFGSYAGLAAVVGLGVLALLYVSQAREVKRLREWAGRAPERTAELEERVRADAQRRIVSQPVGAQTVAGQAAAAARFGTLPGAMPSSGTVSAATPVPGASPAPTPGPPAPGVPGTTPPAVPGAVPAARPPFPPAKPAVMPAGAAGSPTRIVPVHRSPGELAAPAVPSAQTAAPPAAPPVTADPGATSAFSPPPAPPESGNGGQRTGSLTPPPVRPLPYEPLRVPPSATPRVDEPEPVRESGGGVSGRMVAAVVGGLAVIVAIVLVATIGGGDDPTPVNRVGEAPAIVDDPDPESPAESPAEPLDRASIKVAVLNGTVQTGLARNVANELEDGGFSTPVVTDATDQTQTKSTVAYRPGSRRAALAVARIVGVPGGEVRPVDRSTAVAAGDTAVVVTVAADRIG